MGRVYDEPTAQWHRFRRYAPAPDPHRPGFTDPRVIETTCALTVAMVGVPANRPWQLSACPTCYPTLVAPA